MGGYVGLRPVQSACAATCYATSHWDNDTALTGFGVTRKVQSFHTNLIIWSPAPKLDFGVEAIWGEHARIRRQRGLLRLHTLALLL